jgi:hypothetical protein
MGEEWMALQGFNDRDNSVMATDPQVVALGNIVGQDDSGGGSDSGKDGQKNSPFQGLGLIDDDKGVMQRTSTNMGQG